MEEAEGKAFCQIVQTMEDAGGKEASCKMVQRPDLLDYVCIIFFDKHSPPASAL